MADPLTIVTAFDERYWRSADQLLRSASRHDLQHQHRFVAYDLGVSAPRLAELSERWPWCEWRSFDLTRHPPHFEPARRTYAWKPHVIAHAAREGAPLLWLDSATLFHTSDLSAVGERIHRHGTYTLRGQKTLGEGCDHGVLRRLDCATELWTEPIHVSGVVGLDPRNPVVSRVLQAWCDAANDPDCNLPPGPAHSADQSLLSIALHNEAAREHLLLNGEDIDISSDAPVTWMSSRNKVRPWLPRLADPLARAYYATYKALDRQVIRSKRFYRERVSGLHRATYEHYCVYVQPPGHSAYEVQAPRGSYYADPFVWCVGERAWLFVEEFRYLEHKGRIVALPLGDAGVVGAPCVVLDTRWHCSFPYLFAAHDKLYMVPETSAQRTVDLYECVAFPGEWRLARRLLVDVDAADSVVFEAQGHFWLITSLREGDGRRLAVYFADDLYGVWHEHAVSKQRLYADAPHGFGRNGGSIVCHEGQWRRTLQASRDYYGQAVQHAVLSELSTDRYEERIVGAPSEAHHSSDYAGWRAWDVRDRVPFGM